MSDSVKPKLDEFTSKVVSDPAKPQETLLLQGFLGAASQPDQTRVYSDLTLESYVDVADADIIHVEPIPKEQSPLGGSYLWVYKSAEAVPAGAAGAKAKFLEGPITSEAATAAGRQTNLIKTVPIVACHPTIVIPYCPRPTVVGYCYRTVSGPECGVRTPLCPQQAVSIACGEGPGAGGQQQFAAAAVPAQPQYVGATEVCPGLQTYFGPHCQFQTAYCPHTGTAGGPIRQQEAQFAVAAMPAKPQFEPATAACPQPTPTVAHYTQYEPECYRPTEACPLQTAYEPNCRIVTRYCPYQQASIACGIQHQPAPEQFAAAARPTTAVAVCRHPSVNNYECVSVNHYKCPPKTSRAADCPYTPNIQHCPTPNDICPRPTSLPCPSVTDVCATSSPLFC